MIQVKSCYWAVCISVFVVSVMAIVTSPWLSYTFNLTHSLTGHFYIIYKGGKVTKGDLIAYRWQGGATYPPGTLFIKRVVGVAGDAVQRVGSTFWVNGQYIGDAKPFSKAGIPLHPAAPGVIPPHAYFVATMHPDSLDSRYALTGNVRQIDVIGRAYEIF